MPRYKITLEKSEREDLEQLTRKEKIAASKFIHARILLLCDAGEYNERTWKVSDAADALGITSRTIEKVKKRFVEEGLDSALERKPTTRKPDIKYDGEFDARIMQMACSECPKGYSRWTVRLLAEKAVELNIVDTVSTMTIQRSLKKTNCVLI
jgi:transposase